jgi:hypothetical protein
MEPGLMHQTAAVCKKALKHIGIWPSWHIAQY